MTRTKDQEDTELSCFVIKGVGGMLAEDRRSYILNLLGTRSSVTVAELSAAFGLSEVSVRKLLSNMEQEGVIKRTWGGAVSAYGSLREFSHKEKEPICLAEKQSIARAAYHCIADGDAVFLDCGTTTAQLARLIRNGKKRNLMVATTGLNIAMELADADDISVIVIGGELRHNILSCTGTFAENMLKTMFFDKGFISGNHLSLEHGFTTPSVQEAKLKRMIMDNCKEHYVLMDCTKFGDDSLSLIASCADLDCVITDWHAPESIVNGLREEGVRVMQGTEEIA